MSVEDILKNGESSRAYRAFSSLVRQSMTRKPRRGPVLGRLLERKGLPASSGWQEVLAQGLTAEDLEWLTERFDRTVPTEALRALLSCRGALSSPVLSTRLCLSALERSEDNQRRSQVVSITHTLHAVPRVHQSTICLGAPPMSPMRHVRRARATTLRGALHSTHLLYCPECRRP